MYIETGSFFDKIPQALPLYKMFAEKVLAEYSDVQIMIQNHRSLFPTSINLRLYGYRFVR